MKSRGMEESRKVRREKEEKGKRQVSRENGVNENRKGIASNKKPTGGNEVGTGKRMQQEKDGKVSEGETNTEAEQTHDGARSFISSESSSGAVRVRP